jgi:hypothetical protein
VLAMLADQATEWWCHGANQDDCAPPVSRQSSKGDTSATWTHAPSLTLSLLHTPPPPAAPMVAALPVKVWNQILLDSVLTNHNLVKVILTCRFLRVSPRTRARNPSLNNAQATATSVLWRKVRLTRLSHAKFLSCALYSRVGAVALGSPSAAHIRKVPVSYSDNGKADLVAYLSALPGLTHFISDLAVSLGPRPRSATLCL